MTIQELCDLLKKSKWYFDPYISIFDNQQGEMTIDGSFSEKKLKKELKQWQKK